jgi:cysteine desulfuration protein SufE
VTATPPPASPSPATPSPATPSPGTGPAATGPGAGLPAPLAEVVEEFQALGQQDRLLLLLEFSESLPELPERFAEHPELLEPVPECQSPVFLAVEVGDGGRVHLFFSAPREAPTTRGFAGVLHAGLDGLAAEEVLAVPDDLSSRLGLDAAVSLLRLRGMTGMLMRIQRQVRAATAASERPVPGQLPA